MKDRIKRIRKENKMTQVEFGEKIGVKGNTITNYETGLRNPTDAVILSICREFNVNEEWLRTGNGEMFIPRGKEEELAEFFADLQRTGDESFRHRLVLALAKMSDSGWDELEALIDSMQKQ